MLVAYDTHMGRGAPLLICCIALVAACGEGVSEDPLAIVETGGAGSVTATGAVSGGGNAPIAGSGGVAGHSGGSGGTGTGAAPSDGPGGAGTGGGISEPEGSPNGTDCTSSADCSSRVCQQDATGSSRCCEDDCQATGRVCSASGACVCWTRDVGGTCLLPDGAGCEQNTDCASDVCAQGVCCNDACDGLCERCDNPQLPGECSFFAEDTRCSSQPGHQCKDRDRCLLTDGETCGSDPDCHSGNCEPAVSDEQVCCESECNGVCQKCGIEGRCDGAPAMDVRCGPVTCEPDTKCTEYEPPSSGACSGNGVCAGCTPHHKRAGVPCGVGSQCNGQGVCRYTGIGQVAAAGRHTCAIRDNGNVVCWGRNHAGQLGAAFDHPLVGVTESPAQITSLEINFSEDVVQLAAGFLHTCALLYDGTVRCWGRVENELVWGTVRSVLGTTDIALNSLGFVDPLRTGPVKLPGLAVQITAASGGAHTCALLESGAVSCWGYNANAQLGLGHQLELDLAAYETLPVVELGGHALEVKAAAGHTCALLAGGLVKCWGEGNLGRLGYGSNLMQRTPGPDVEIGARAVHIATASGHTCAVLETGRVRCWGHNNEGQLGYGHTTNIGDNETPAAAATMAGPAGRTYLGGDVEVGGGAAVVQITHIADERATCARFASGSVRCWGRNQLGQLGYGHNTAGATTRTPDELAFLPLSGGGNWGGDVDLGGKALALAEGGRCVLRVDGQLFCWGKNDYGELGLPSAGASGSLTLTPAELGPVFWK